MNCCVPHSDTTPTGFHLESPCRVEVLAPAPHPFRAPWAPTSLDRDAESISDFGGMALPGNSQRHPLNIPSVFKTIALVSVRHYATCDAHNHCVRTPQTVWDARTRCSASIP